MSSNLWQEIIVRTRADASPGVVISGASKVDGRLLLTCIISIVEIPSVTLVTSS